MDSNTSHNSCVMLTTLRKLYIGLALVLISSHSPYAQVCSLDMFVANDQSGSVDSYENNQSRQFITALMQGMQPWGSGIGEHRMAISDWASAGTWTQFNFPIAGQNYTTHLSDVLAYQLAPRALSGGTGPYSALWRTHQQIQQSPVPGRDSKKIIVLMTDASCPQVPPGMSTLATQIKNEGVFIIVVAIGAASLCPTLAGENVASPGGYFAADGYGALIQANVQLVQDIISTACNGPISETYDLSISLDAYTATNCTNGVGTYTVDYTIYNGANAQQDFNDEILISFYNGNPSLPTSTFLNTHSTGVQTLPIGTSYSGSFTSPTFFESATLYALVNYDGSTAGHAPPVPTYFYGETYIADEVFTYNNFSNGETRVGDASCPPYAIITTNVTTAGVGCDDLVLFDVTICNTGDADAFLSTTLPIATPGAVQLNDTNAEEDLTGDLSWATYYGDAELDHGYSVATDHLGNVYLAGSTESENNIATPGAHQTSHAGGLDAFLIKFDTDGNRLWGTYYGDEENDNAFDVATDPSGNVYIVGNTESQNNISTPGAHQTTHMNSDDAYIVKFNSAGVRQWASYYGGSNVDFGQSVATDASGNVYLAGFTEGSTTLASIGAHQTAFGGNADPFLVKFNSAGVRQWATYCGGAGEDINADVATDPLGNVFLTATTQSSSGISTPGTYQPAYNGDDDVFIVKFNSAGVRQWGTYYGGTGTEKNSCIASDLSGNIYLGGEVNSLDFIAFNAHQGSMAGLWDGFVAKFNTSGARLWSTYYGGGGEDAVRSIDTGPAGNVFVSGSSSSSGGLSTAGSHKPFGSGPDAFLGKFTSDGTLDWGTYYGGPVTEEGLGVSINTFGHVYISGITTSSIGVATTDAHQTVYGTFEDAFLAKFFEKDIGGIIYSNECITEQYIFDYSTVTPGTYDFSFGVVADTVLLGDGSPVVLPDTNFTVGSFLDQDGFNGTLHSSDDITLVAGGPTCPLGDQVNIAVDIANTASCGSGNFSQAIVTIENLSGIPITNTYLHLNLSGLNASFAGELYGLSPGLDIPPPDVLDPLYPAVPYALFTLSGDQILPIYSIPAGSSSFHVDLNPGTALTNLTAQIDSIHSVFNASGQSNLASDAEGLVVNPYPTITGFNCPGSITVGNSIDLNGISTTQAATVHWSSTSMPSLTNIGTLSNPSISYAHSPMDEANGYVEINLTATSATGCETTVTCQVNITNVLYDYGDAPISYDQNVNVQPLAAASTLMTGLHLGSIGPSTENAANNSVNASGDGIEEDGIISPVNTPMPTIGQVFDLTAEATNTSNELAYLNAFIDWNADGDFLDSLECALSPSQVPALSGTQAYTIQYTVPEDLDTLATMFFIRIRLSTDSFAISRPYQGAPQGETEDNVWPPAPPLPIELIDFTATSHALSNHLHWATASEVNNDHFIVERSSSGANYETLSRVQGAGNSSQILEYHYYDEPAPKGTSYYRLKQVDFDGKHEYLGPVVVYQGGDENAWIEYLGPNVIRVRGISYSAERLELYDLSGSRHSLDIDSSGRIETNGLAHGLYFILVKKPQPRTLRFSK